MPGKDTDRSMFKSKLSAPRRVSRTKGACCSHTTVESECESEKRPPTAEGKKFDIFGALPQDLQIDVLGYVAAERPAQVLLMRKVCRTWRDVLSDDSIYHSALYTASFSHPSHPSLEAFQSAAWSDDRIRKVRLTKGRSIWYAKDQRDNNNIQPKKVIYRDGFIVWWVQGARYFRYVDLNRAKKPKKAYVVESGITKGWRSPLYTQAGGKLVYGEGREEKDLGWVDNKLHVVKLQEPLQRGEVSLASLRPHSGGVYEIHCSGEYVLVLRGHKILVADMRDVTATKVTCIINLKVHSNLSSPIVNTIEISNKDSCLVVLTSGQSVEVIAFSLLDGARLKRNPGKPLLDGRKEEPGTIYHIQHSTDFAHDTQYQFRNPTNKNHPSMTVPRAPHRWIRIPASLKDGDECTTGTYTHHDHFSEPDLTSPLTKHSVSFARQAVTFTALREKFDTKSVDRISLRITTGNVGAEIEDTDSKEIGGVEPTRTEIGTPISSGKRTAIDWTHKARMVAPSDCMSVTDENVEFIDTTMWVQQRRNWAAHSILLGDEKALVLALPHQIVVWRFETEKMWRERSKKRVRKMLLQGLLGIFCIPAYAAAVVGAVPVVFTIVVWKACGKCRKKVKASETWRKIGEKWEKTE